VRITALANPEFWMTRTEPEYLEAKQKWSRRIVESALRFIPDFRPFVVDADQFTPHTIHRYTGHLHGAVYGAPDKQLSGATEIRNLYLCGTDQGFLGIIGSMLSGITMANNHLLPR
jgi:phytoene dehydrogenase-like protein